MVAKATLGWAALLLAYLVLGIAFLLAPDVVNLAGHDSKLPHTIDALCLRLVAASFFTGLSGLIVFTNIRAKSARNGHQLLDPAFLDSLPQAHCLLDATGRVRFANRSFRKMLEGEGRAFRGNLVQDLLRPMHGVSTFELPQGEADGEGGSTQRLQIGERQIEAVTAALHGGTPGWLLTLHDITELEELRAKTALLTRALDVIEDGVMISDSQRADYPIVYANAAIGTITGFNPVDIIGRNPRYLHAGDHNQAELRQIGEALADAKPVVATLRNYRRSGELFFNRLRLAPVHDAAGRATHVIGALRDVTDLVDATNELQTLASKDTLTGQLNRDGLTARLRQLLDGSSDTQLLTVKLNIEAFHGINTTWGYVAGDALLSLIGERLQRMGADAVGRLDADNFFYVKRITSGPEPVLAELTRQLAGEYIVPGVSLRVFFHIGYTVTRCDAKLGTVVRQSAAALYEAKRSRVLTPYAYNTELDREISRRLRISGDLHQALENNDLVLHYQPKVDLLTGRVIGAEALIRWNHPTFGLQLPGRFIPSAEHSGLILPIGEFALRKAADCAHALMRAGIEGCPVAVNVSIMQFRQTDIAALLESVLQESGLPPELLILELTENLFAEDFTRLETALRQIRALGVGIAIDDFGTGYSSLRYVGNLPVTEIKIDRSFVKGMHQGPSKRVVIEAVLGMGHDLGIDVVAEGVEDEADRDILLQLGCSKAQGYFFSRPLVETDFVRLVTQRATLPMAQASSKLSAANT